jgi:hypothetical protein
VKLIAGRPPEESAEARAIRTCFRNSLNPEQRATMAIGAITLHWSYLDSEMADNIVLLKTALQEQKIDASHVQIRPMHSARLKALRQYLVLLTGKNNEHVKEFNKLVNVIKPCTQIRHNIAHNTVTFSNPTGKPNDLCIMFFQRDKPDQQTGILITRFVRDVFQAADTLWKAVWDLRAIVIGAINSKDEE